jgi:HTH-type transcriptional regulator / antitoxin HigA
METLKYKVIKNEKQYDEYCQVLHDLDFLTRKKTKAIQDEIELLVLLIEKWDAEHNVFDELDPVQLLRSFIDDHKLKAKDLVEILGISKGYVSDILNYKKGLSKEVIRKLAERFKVSQEAFNRPYKLVVPENSHLRNASVMNTKKELVIA